MNTTSTLLLGIGNTLLTDEGAGVHAMNSTHECLGTHPEISFLDGGTLSFTLATDIEECDNLIVFDAAELQQPAGTIRVFEGDDMDNFLGTAKRSPHEVGLLDLMDIARITDSLPQHRALIGIQPASFGWSMEPSPEVQASLPHVVTKALRLLSKWHVIDTDQYRPDRLHVNVSNDDINALGETR